MWEWLLQKHTGRPIHILKEGTHRREVFAVVVSSSKHQQWSLFSIGPVYCMNGEDSRKHGNVSHIFITYQATNNNIASLSSTVMAQFTRSSSVTLEVQGDALLIVSSCLSTFLCFLAYFLVTDP
jgi:hypothetical protein